MSDDLRTPSNGLRVLVAAASLVVVIAGLRASGDIILPILFSVFLSIAALPMLRALQRVGVPTIVGIPLVVLLFAGLLVGITSVLAGAVRQFTADIDSYEEGFNLLMQQGLAWAAWAGLTDFEEVLQRGQVSQWINPGAIMGIVGQTVNAVIGLFGRVVIVIITMTFMLLEASELEQKLRLAFGTSARPAGPFTSAGEKVTRYLLIKTLISAFTGICAALICRFAGLDFWVMWGLIAFLLNYIPSIGSILAAVPPMLLAMVQLGPGSSLGIGASYLVANLVFGNLLEPRLMGQSLGLSPLVVFLSLVFWGWVWGPVGMLLCVPMTVMGKLVLESNADTRWIAVFLGSPRDVRRTGVPPT